MDKHAIRWILCLGGSWWAACATPDPAPSAPASLNHARVYVESGRPDILQAQVDVGFTPASEAERLEIWGRALCETPDGLVVDHDTTVGGSILSYGLGFFDDVPLRLERCSVSLRASGRDGALSIPLGDLCWDGASSSAGACEGLHTSPSAAASPPVRLEVASVQLDDGLRVVVRHQDHGETPYTHIVALRARCQIGSLGFIEVYEQDVHRGPFPPAFGATHALAFTVFDDEDRYTAEELAAAACSIEVTATDADQERSFGRGQACWKSGTLTAEACEPIAAPIPEGAGPAGLTIVAARFASKVEDGQLYPSFTWDVQRTAAATSALGRRHQLRCGGSDGTPATDDPYHAGQDAEPLTVGEAARWRFELLGDGFALTAPSWCDLQLFDEDGEPIEALARCWTAADGAVRPGTCPIGSN